MGYSTGNPGNRTLSNFGITGQYNKLSEPEQLREKERSGIQNGKDGTGSRVKRLITVEPVILLYYMAYQASQPIQSQYLYTRLIREHSPNVSSTAFSAIDTYNTSTDNYTCGIAGDADRDVQHKAQAIAALYSIAFGLATVVPALLTTVLFGSYSDRAGRKWAILPPAIGDLSQTVICMLVVAFELPLPLLIFGQFCEGIVGSAALILSASFAYIADVTTKEERALRIVVIDILLGVGNMAANIGIGYIIKGTGYFYSFVIVFFLNLANFLYIAFYLPETRKKQPGAKFLSFINYKKPIQLYTKRHVTPRRAILGVGLLIFMLYMVSDQANSSPFDLYVMKEPLCWGPVTIGYYQAVNILVRYVMSFVLLKVLLKPLSETGLLILGCVSCVLYDIVLSQSKLTWIAFISPVAGFGMELVTSMVRAVASQAVSGDEQGALFSGHSWISLLSGLSGAIIFNIVYAKTVSFEPGFIFYVAAISFTILTLLACILHYLYKTRKHLLGIGNERNQDEKSPRSLDQRGEKTQDIGSVSSRLDDIPQLQERF